MRALACVDRHGMLASSTEISRPAVTKFLNDAFSKFTNGRIRQSGSSATSLSLKVSAARNALKRSMDMTLEIDLPATTINEK